MFKKGDRVECVRPDGVISKGMLGTVMENGASSPYVKWDNYHHYGTYTGHYAMEQRELKLVDTGTAFKVGDKVAFRTDGAYSNWGTPYKDCYGVVTEIIGGSECARVQVFNKKTDKKVGISWDSEAWAFGLWEIELYKEKETSMYEGYKVDLSWIKGTAREVLSFAVQKKAFDIGYKWFGNSLKERRDTASYLFMDKNDMVILFGDTKKEFDVEGKPFQEVSVNNWLEGKLPVTKPAYTPKKGDAVLVRDNRDGDWVATVFQNMEGKTYKSYSGYMWNFCIPFDTDLVGTTKESK